MLECLVDLLDFFYKLLSELNRQTSSRDDLEYWDVTEFHFFTKRPVGNNGAKQFLSINIFFRFLSIFKTMRLLRDQDD